MQTIWKHNVEEIFYCRGIPEEQQAKSMEKDLKKLPLLIYGATNSEEGFTQVFKEWEVFNEVYFLGQLLEISRRTGLF